MLVGRCAEKGLEFEKWILKERTVANLIFKYF